MEGMFIAGSRRLEDATGDDADLGVEGREAEDNGDTNDRRGRRDPSSMSAVPSEGSVVSVPSAWPVREPASATLSMGALERLV